MLPETFHADWASSRVTPISIEDEIWSSLIKAEKASLTMLLADRLPTGGWSKSMACRFLRSKKPLSPVGSLTGTYMALESLRWYGYCETATHCEILFANLGRIMTRQGSVAHSVQLTSAGVPEVVPENLRHSSAYMLLRPTFVRVPTREDGMLAAWIKSQLNARVEHGPDDADSFFRNDLLGTVFAASALLSAGSWLGSAALDVSRVIRETLVGFSNLTELRVPADPLWGAEPGAAAATDTAAQWAVAWLLAAMSGWNGCERSTRRAIWDSLLSLIEGSISYAPSREVLLPQSFSQAVGTVVGNP